MQASFSNGFLIIPLLRAIKVSEYEQLFTNAHLPQFTQSDKGSTSSDTYLMTDITREELSMTLSAIEERMDRRVERMEQDSARRSDDLRREMRLRERSARRESIATKEALQAHIESNDKAVASTLAALERTEKEFGTVKQANKEQRYWMAGIGVAIVLGIMGANATILEVGRPSLMAARTLWLISST